MAQTERITFLATKEVKKWLESEAKKSGMSISELIRLRCESGSCEEELLLRGLFNEVKAAVKKATASLDKGLKDADDTIRELRKNRELRKKSDLEK